MARIRLLHLEDDPTDAELMWVMLKHEGFEFDAIRVENREDFVAAIKTKAYDLILADYSLPSFDGLTALILATDIAPEIPFILVSGELGEDLAIEAMKAGATDYVLKGNLSRLAPAVRRALRESEGVREKKKAQAESIESEQRYQQLFDAAIDGVLVIDADSGAILGANAAAEKMYGYSKEEFKKLSVGDLSTNPEATRLALEAMSTLGVTRIPERIHRRKDGTVFAVEINASLFEFHGKPVVGSFVRDISERKRIEEERALLVAAVEQSPDAVVITNLDGIVRYVNAAFETISGYSRFEVLGKSIKILQSGVHDDDFYRELWGTISSGKRWNGTFVNKSRDGTLYNEQATIAPVEDESGRSIAYVAIKRDVTEELKQEESLRRAQRLEALGQLAGGIAHDFNNLLMVISGAADLLGVKTENLDCGTDETDTIFATVKRGAELTRHLLAVARQQVLRIEAINVKVLLEEEIGILRRVIPENIEIVLTSMKDTLVMDADAGQIGQVLMNLIVNARDAMPDGGLIKVLADRFEIEEKDAQSWKGMDAGRYIRISVRDTGEGMDAVLKEKVFEPFFTTKAAGKGTGMGLATVYGIVKQHRGFIDLTSEVGIGTTFDLYLPESVEAAVAAVSETRAPSQGGVESILVVEDDPGVLWAVKGILKNLGYNVIEAENGQVALAKLVELPGNIDLVMSDVVMPKMSGPELYAAARGIGCEASFLFSSGYAKQAAWSEIKDEDDVDFIAKPYGMEDLAAKVRDILDR